MPSLRIPPTSSTGDYAKTWYLAHTRASGFVICDRRPSSLITFVVLLWRNTWTTRSPVGVGSSRKKQLYYYFFTIVLPYTQCRN
jgi:hypothetical protein